MSYLTRKESSFSVPDTMTIPCIPGDGIGPEVWAAARHVTDEIINSIYKGKKEIIWQELPVGQKSFEKTGEYITQESIDIIKNAFVAVKGPLMTPVGGGIRSLNVALRKSLDLFACVRPVNWFEGIPTPVHHPDKVDMHIFRENTEDIYAGIEFSLDSDKNKQLMTFLKETMGVDSIRFPDSTALGVKPISKEGSQRLVRSAINFAIDHNLPTVTLVHKGNIMKYTEGAFRDWGYEVADAEFADHVITQKRLNAIRDQEGPIKANNVFTQAQADKKVYINDCIADAFFQESLINPENYSVVATTNLNGDYISDALAAQVGGIGISPGANINFVTGHAIFEATHGTAPSIAGQNIANPSAMLLSVAMLCDYIQLNEVASAIRQGIQHSILDNKVTKDFTFDDDAPYLGTREFSESVLAYALEK